MYLQYNKTMRLVNCQFVMYLKHLFKGKLFRSLSTRKKRKIGTVFWLLIKELEFKQTSCKTISRKESLEILESEQIQKNLSKTFG